MSAPTLPTIKGLFAKSRNLCAFPDCVSPIVEASGTVTAGICHIRALNSRGPRYDKSQLPEDRNATANLVLMCGRHHKIIDTETKKYTPAVLMAMKMQHEERGVIDISPSVVRVAEELLSNYINIIGNKGNIAIHSPNAVQANTINFNSTKQKVTISPPAGTIVASALMSSYCSHLIERYQDYQKADSTGKTSFKHQAIHLAMQRKFNRKWKLVDEEKFPDLVIFLQDKIDKTIIGKINKSKNVKNYSSFEKWIT